MVCVRRAEVAKGGARIANPRRMARKRVHSVDNENSSGPGKAKC